MKTKSFFQALLLLTVLLLTFGCEEYADYNDDSDDNIITKGEPSENDVSKGDENLKDTDTSDDTSQVNLNRAERLVNISPVWLENGNTWVQVVTSLPPSDTLVVLLEVSHWINVEDEFPFMVEKVPVAIEEGKFSSEKMFVRQFPGTATAVSIHELEELEKVKLPI